MKKNRFEIQLVYKCGGQSFDVYHHVITDEDSEKVFRVLRSLLSRILRIGSFSLEIVPLAEDEQVFQPSFNSYSAVQAISYDLLNIVASSCYGK